MNRKITYTLAVGMISLLLVGCIKSDLSHCSSKKDLRVKVLDKHGSDITKTGKSGDVLLFAFDGEGNFLSRQFVSVDSVKRGALIPISLKLGEVRKYVAWGNVTDTTRMLLFDPANKLADNRVKPVISDQGYATIPADIFYGRQAVDESETKGTGIIEVVMKRAVSQLHVTIVGMPPGTNPNDYAIVVADDDQNGLDFENRVTRDGTVKYVRKPVWFQKDKMMGTEDVFTTFPSPEGASKTIMLYKGKKLEAVATEDINRQPIAPKPDERLNVLIDLDQDCPDYPYCDEELQVHIVVSDWDEVVIWKVW